MIYLDAGATTLQKPPSVAAAVSRAIAQCATPGRGGHPPAMRAAEAVYDCRLLAAELFDCRPERVVFTMNATHALNLAIKTLVKPGQKAVISGFEHNAVTRPLHALGADIRVAGRRLFDWEDTLSRFGRELKQGADAAVFTHVSNVFGYILPVEQLAEMCRKWRVPFIIDAAQSAGALPVDLQALGAEFIAMPGHKGLLGPQGTGLLLCGGDGKPLLFGGTGSDSVNQAMPDYLPDRLEAGTLNVPGYAGLTEGLRFVRRTGAENIFRREHRQLERCVEGLQKLGMEVFAGAHQASTVSFRPEMDCEEAAAFLAKQGIAVRAGLHCAPFAHESAGTLESGTVRVSFGHDASDAQTDAFLRSVSKLPIG